MLSVKMLSEFSGRENNYTFLRICFAIVVLIGHSFHITGNGYDPISRMLQPYAWIGGIAVDGFFAISGFLVTSSYMSRGPANYLISRALRLYPAIIAYSFIAILLIGPISINVPLSTYFAADPWNNLLNVPLWTWKYNLPYAFHENHFSGSTNGSTWTLPVELRCYILIFTLGCFGIFESRLKANVALFGALFAAYYNNLAQFIGCEDRAMMPLAFFLLGSLARVNHQLIPLNLVAAGAATIIPFFTTGNAWHPQIMQVCLTYVILVLVYVAPYINVQKIGDISYGIYIYSWPIQQMVWHKDQSGYLNAAFALPVVILAAYLSWRFIEAPALELRERLPEDPARAFRRLLGTASSALEIGLKPFVTRLRLFVRTADGADG